MIHCTVGNFPIIIMLAKLIAISEHSIEFTLATGIKKHINLLNEHFVKLIYFVDHYYNIST